VGCGQATVSENLRAAICIGHQKEKAALKNSTVTKQEMSQKKLKSSAVQSNATSTPWSAQDTGGLAVMSECLWTEWQIFTLS
jgi:hypothetical protein